MSAELVSRTAHEAGPRSDSWSSIAVSPDTLAGLTDLQIRRLQRLVPLTEHDIRHEPEWVREVLMRALDGERRRGRAIHWSYCPNRHIALRKALDFYEGRRETPQ